MLFFARLLCFLLLITTSLTAARAQTGEPLDDGFEEIPLDTNDAAVRRLRQERRPSRAFRSLSQRSIEPGAAAADRRFLVALDFEQLPSGMVDRVAGRQRSARLRQTNEETLMARTHYLKYGFVTSYEEFNATLECHWKFDGRLARQKQSSDAKNEEERLERLHRERLLGLKPPVVPRSERRFRERNPFGAAVREHGLIIQTRQFKVGGRPCVLTAICNPKRPDDARKCIDVAVDALVKSATLVRAGE